MADALRTTVERCIQDAYFRKSNVGMSTTRTTALALVSGEPNPPEQTVPLTSGWPHYKFDESGIHRWPGVAVT